MKNWTPYLQSKNLSLYLCIVLAFGANKKDAEPHPLLVEYAKKTGDYRKFRP